MSRSAFRRRDVVALSTAALAMRGSARAAEAGDPVIAYWGEPVRVGQLARGDWLVAMLDGDPVFVRRRTPAQIAAARAAPLSDLPDPATDEARAPGGEWLVVSGICTHAGCQVQGGLGPYEGWQCLCHGSTYDLSGRIRRGPARHNLPVIAHRLAGDSILLLRHAA